MNITDTIKKLHALKLIRMVATLEEQQQQNSITELSFQERFSLVIKRLWLLKEYRALAGRPVECQLFFTEVRNNCNLPVVLYLPPSI